jgi:epoxyqueuosine reductase
VCPPTRRASPPVDAAYEARDASDAFPSLVDLLHLRGGEFKRRYRRTAMGWRGGTILRRNAAVALGNALDRSAVPALETALRDDPHPLVRGHVAWALGRIGSPQALIALRNQADRETDGCVREEIAAALAAWETLGPSRALDASGTAQRSPPAG